MVVFLSFFKRPFLKYSSKIERRDKEKREKNDTGEVEVGIPSFNITH